MERKLFRKGHFNLIIKYIHNYSSTLHTDCKNYTAVVVIDYSVLLCHRIYKQLIQLHTTAELTIIQECVTDYYFVYVYVEMQNNR